MENSDRGRALRRNSQSKPWCRCRPALVALLVSIVMPLISWATDLDSTLWNRNGYVFDLLTTGDRTPQMLTEDDKQTLQQDLKSLLCNDGSYFRECLTLTEKECTGQVQQNLTICLKEDRSTQTKAGASRSEFAFNIGWCVGNRLLEAKDQKSLSAKCQNMNYWK